VSFLLNVIFGVLGGLALFLFGMKIMGEGLQKVAGDKIRKILERVTRYPVVAVLLGAVTTAAIQSSSATTVLVVGFVNAGLMTLKQAIGVIMGANIGTTITAQLIAFKLTDYVFLIIAIGFCINFFSKRRVYHYVGQFILGIGILFLGLDVMSNAVVPLRGSPVFLDFIASFSRYPLLGVLVGIIITCVVQSSAATIGMLIALASQDIITFNAAIPVLFGDNIGTCITALLASIGTNLNARRAAVAHVMFNVTGTLIFLILLPWFREFVYFISPSEPARLIANAHTSFNILNTCLFLPFVGAFTKLIEKLLPGTVEIEEKGPIYLDERMFDTPAVALSLATKEIIRMGNIASRSLESAMQGFYEKNERFLEATKEDEEIIDELEREITFYLAKPAAVDAPSNYAVIGRYIITPEIFEILGKTGPGAGGEIQLTDALRELARIQPIYACLFSGERYDVGDKLGFLQATVMYALNNAELGTSFRQFLKDAVQNGGERCCGKK
jgi:phosphate:Na+ symporter